MRQRAIIYLPRANRDSRAIAVWIAEKTSDSFAAAYAERIVERIESLAYGGELGTLRDDVRPGLRVIGLMKSVTVAFFVEDDAVMVARIFYGGQNWQTDLTAEEP